MLYDRSSATEGLLLISEDTLAARASIETQDFSYTVSPNKLIVNNNNNSTSDHLFSPDKDELITVKRTRIPSSAISLFFDWVLFVEIMETSIGSLEA